MKLSLEQIEVIREHVDQSTISIDSLKDDVLDHLCCVVEIKMERGKVFDASVQEALVELAPDGLDEIQRETVFLLNSTKIIRMKKVMFLTGLVTAMCMSIGWTLKSLHLPGGNELPIYGSLGFGLLFIPMVVINYFKMNLNAALSEKLKVGFGILSTFFLCLAITFKIKHLIGADQLIIAGAVLFSFGFLPFWFFSMYKKSVS